MLKKELCVEKVKRIIETEINNKGLRFDTYKANTTNSWYYIVYLENTSIFFRISDHYTDKKMITLRYDHRMKEKDVVNFVQNRLSSLKRKRLYKLLEM